MKNLTLLFLILLLFSECKKEKDTEEPVIITQPTEISHYDTLKPLSYYPIYPGSYWEYLENDTDTIVHHASSTYLKHSYVSGHEYDSVGNSKNIYSDTLYVPFLNGKPIYQYDKIEVIYPLPPKKTYDDRWPILSEAIGAEFYRSYMDPRYGEGEKIIVEQKTVNSNQDSILILKGHWKYGFQNRVSIQEYTKDIGLSSHLIIDTVTMDTVYKLQLIDYHINK